MLILLKHIIFIIHSTPFPTKLAKKPVNSENKNNFEAINIKQMMSLFNYYCLTKLSFI